MVPGCPVLLRIAHKKETQRQSESPTSRVLTKQIKHFQRAFPVLSADASGLPETAAEFDLDFLEIVDSNFPNFVLAWMVLIDSCEFHGTKFVSAALLHTSKMEHGVSFHKTETPLFLFFFPLQAHTFRRSTLAVLDHLHGELLVLAHYLGPPRLHVSIYESGSNDTSPAKLRAFQKDLRLLRIPHTIVTEGAFKRADQTRIEFLATARNLALAPILREVRLSS
jgi:hypothetical protein